MPNLHNGLSVSVRTFRILIFVSTFFLFLCLEGLNLLELRVQCRLAPSLQQSSCFSLLMLELQTGPTLPSIKSYYL